MEERRSDSASLGTGLLTIDQARPDRLGPMANVDVHTISSPLQGRVVEVQSGLCRDAEVERQPLVKEGEVREILLRRLGQARGLKALQDQRRNRRAGEDRDTKVALDHAQGPAPELDEQGIVEA